MSVKKLRIKFKATIDTKLSKGKRVIYQRIVEREVNKRLSEFERSAADKFVDKLLNG